MVSDVKQAVIDKLAELYPTGYTFYTDNVPQKFKKPSFLVSIFEQAYQKLLNVRCSSVLSFDIAYFSEKGMDEIISDCLNTQENLLRHLDRVGSFRVINKISNATDNVLHITFDIKYSEMKLEEDTLMQSLTTNTNL